MANRIYAGAASVLGIGVLTAAFHVGLGAMIDTTPTKHTPEGQAAATRLMQSGQEQQDRGAAYIKRMASCLQENGISGLEFCR
jgi:hypothetical protein